jgi:thymidine kinase
MSGKLELIIGPMFSGKSTELIRKIRQLQIIDKKVLVIKPKIDIRYNINKITSHNYDSVECIDLNRLDDITYIKDYDTIVIDEGQFFPDLLDTVVKWIENYLVDIIIGGLDGDFQRQPIGSILNLIPYADSCIKLSSLCNICKNGTPAPFTFRLIESSAKILVGGAESYSPVCRKHFIQLNSEK